MVDKKHILIQDFLKCMIQLWVVTNLHKSAWVSVYSEAHVVKASKEDPLREGGKEPESAVIADLAVGPYHTVSDEKELPNICFSSGTVPKVVIEVTSRSNLLADLVGKTIDYARIKVPQYVIVDREHEFVRVYYLTKPKTPAGSSSSHRSAAKERRSPRITDAKPPSGYPLYKHWREFRGSEVVDAVYLKPMGMTAKDMLNPPCNGTDVHFKNVKRARKQKKETKKARLYGEILEETLKKNGIPIPREALSLKEGTGESSSSSVPSTPSTPSTPASPGSPVRQKPRKS